MSLSAITQLMNLESNLYPNRIGMYPNCPSYINGYYSGLGLNNTAGYNNTYGLNYGNYFNYNNPAFKSNPNSIYQDTYTSSNTVPATNTGGQSPDINNPQFRGLSEDLNILGDYYIKSEAPSESLAGAAMGGVAFGLINNPRMVVHWYNSIKSTKAIEEMFKGIKVDGSKLNLLYNGKLTDAAGKTIDGGYELLSEAYSRMHKLESLNNSKLGLFRKSIKGVKTADGSKLLYDELKGFMEKALKSGNPEEIAKATEMIKRATNAYTGFIPQGFRKIGLQKPFQWLRSKINPSQYEQLEKVVTNNIKEAGAQKTFGQFMKHSCKIGGGIFFAAMEFVNDFSKITTAFEKGSSDDGWKQIGQTAVKGVGSAVGWAVGEGIGSWAGAQIGAALGTAVAPGVGTVIGAVAGLVGGSIGCWLTGKLTHKIIGDDVATKVEVAHMKKSTDGQTKLLQLTAERASDDKKLDARTLQAIQNVAKFYGAQNTQA